MDFTEFTKKDLADILDIVELTLACKIEEDLKGLLADIRKLVGGGQAVSFIGRWALDGFIEPPMAVNDGYSKEFIKIYIEGKLDKVDPALFLTMNNSGSYRLEDSLKDPMGEEFCRRSRLDDFAFRFGICSGLYDKATAKGSAFIFPAPENTFDGQSLEVLDILSPFLHQAHERVFNNNAHTQMNTLTDREMEVIRWIREGKTNWEISMILRISESTANFHVKNILTKLKAVNKAHAVAIALEREYVDL